MQLPKGASAETVAEPTRSLGECNGKLLQEKAVLRAKLLKETGVYVPLWHKEHTRKAMLWQARKLAAHPKQDLTPHGPLDNFGFSTRDT